ncbi:unnamed protein product [Rotaria sordida]|uniref:NAD(+)--protein-arginine ADP-ribosyltransferase n=1 Tax=Rotaria sordida TaxID=392033 RepID=A0A820ALE8_9BILA|nr:unnamed protein product [Rotaria sordida]
MTSSMSSQPTDFYLACCNNDLKTVQENANRSEIDAPGSDGNTPLHAASMYGHAKLVRLLLRYHASRSIRNDEGFTPEELAPNDETRAAFKDPVRTISDSNHFVASSREVEWLDSYKNAYRISYENHEHMKRWLTKVALHKLLKAIVDDYIERIKFKNENDRKTIKEELSYVIDEEDPLGLIWTYTSPSVKFHDFLNHDLAELGSDFRFVSTQALINSGYVDNEPPQGLGQYIFASIIINHSRFRPYHYAGITFRGMKITQKDLEEYNTGNIVLTRSFLSTSKDRSIAELFVDCTDHKIHPPVICKYKVINPKSSLSIEKISRIEDEKEVLILPFTVFQVKQQHYVELKKDGQIHNIKEIELEECGPLSYLYCFVQQLENNFMSINKYHFVFVRDTSQIMKTTFMHLLFPLN